MSIQVKLVCLVLLSPDEQTGKPESRNLTAGSIMDEFGQIDGDDRSVDICPDEVRNHLRIESEKQLQETAMSDAVFYSMGGWMI